MESTRRPIGRKRRSERVIAGGLAVALLLAACGGDDDAKDEGGGERVGTREAVGESGLEEAGAPVRGGRVVYALEGESAGGYCLPESELALSGIMVRSSVYDTLTIDSEEGVVPYLAQSVTPNDELNVWTIVLRPGVTFHDGTRLDATVVKNNLDAWRGLYPGRGSAGGVFTMANIDTVEVADQTTVVVTTKTPWVAFPRLWTSVGIMAQAQLDDAETCETNMIGTGPFKLASWERGRELLVQRNPDYWQSAPDGKPYPYLDAIEFRPIADPTERINALESGEVHAMLTADPNDIAGSLTDLREQEQINLLVSEEHSEVDLIMLNNGKAPFDDVRMRKAVAMGMDREEYNDLTNAGFPDVADQPFPPGDLGYVEDPGFPDHNPDVARTLIDEYKASGGDPSFNILVKSDFRSSSQAELIQKQLAEVGITVRIQSAEETTTINQLVGGDYQASLVRYFPGGEPDDNYILWYSKDDSPINFNRIKSDVIDEALEQGRVEPDPAKRKVIYERISRDFAENVWNIWLNYTPMAAALSSDTHGVYAVKLPDGQDPSVNLSRGHPLHGMWIED